MKKYFNHIKLFYLKNRLWILGGLLFLLLMQVCSQGGKVNHEPVIATGIYEQSEDVNNQLEPLADQPENTPSVRPTTDNNYLFLLLALGLLLAIAYKRRWLDKLMPSIVWVSLKIKKTKKDHTQLAILAVVNKTKDSLTMEAPVIVFKSPLGKSRKFRIKNGNDTVFPLTLMRNTSHRISIDVDRFRQKAGIEKGLKWMKVEIETHEGKTYHSFWKHLR